MELQSGQRVWVGYTESCDDSLKKYRCRLATVLYFNLEQTLIEGKEHYAIRFDNKREASAARHILFPLNDEDEPTKEAQQEDKIVEVET